MNTEWHIPEADVPIRQGDLLVNRDPASLAIQEICVVITADCDISKGKFGRQLACLRLVSLDEYIKTIWAASKLEKAQVAEAKKLRAQIAKWHTELLGVESEISATACVDWVLREDPDALADQLQIPLDERKKFVSSIKSARAAFGKLASIPEASPITRLSLFRSELKTLEVEACRREILQQAQGEQLPEDVFLVSSLPQIEVKGALIMLREIVAIRFQSVHRLATDASEADSFLRIGRLLPTFKYAVSQCFGGLYSRIGLPADYEERCKDVIQTISGFTWEMN